MPRSPADPRRAKAQRLWPDPALSLVDLSRRVGASRSTIRRWAFEGSWAGRELAPPTPRRKQPSPVTTIDTASTDTGLPDTAPPDTAAPRAARGPDKRNVRKTLISRLYRLLNHKIQLMEERMSDENASGKDELERDMRVLGNAVRSVDKLKEVETEQSKRDTGDAAGRAIISPEEEDRIRRKVVEHILKLRERKRRERGDN